MNWAEIFGGSDAAIRNMLAKFQQYMFRFPWKVNTDTNDLTATTRFQINLGDGLMADNSGLVSTIYNLQQNGTHNGVIVNVNAGIPGTNRLFCDTTSDDPMNFFEPQPKIFDGAYENADWTIPTDTSSFILSDRFVTTRRNDHYGILSGSV